MIARPQVARREKPMAFVLVALLLLGLYAIDCAVMLTVAEPTVAFVANVAMPFDLMVFVPAVFYFLVIRPRKITPLLLLPVIYIGGIVSGQFVVEGSFSLHPYLLVAAALADALIALYEVPRLVRCFRDGYRSSRARSGMAYDWFSKGFEAMLGSGIASRMAGMELSVWYYLFASWRDKPDVPKGARAYTTYKDTSYLAIIGVVCALSCVEIVAMHLAVSKFSPIAAVVLTALSLYAMAWIAGSARAVVLNPILLEEDCLTIRWGAFFSERIPLSAIAGIERQCPDLPKSERKDVSSLGADPCWIVLNQPLEIKTALGKTQSVKAFNISPDNAKAFQKDVMKACCR